jgi:hypothetical protein
MKSGSGHTSFAYLPPFLASERDYACVVDSGRDTSQPCPEASPYDGNREMEQGEPNV